MKNMLRAIAGNKRDKLIELVRVGVIDTVVCFVIFTLCQALPYTNNNFCTGFNQALYGPSAFDVVRNGNKSPPSDLGGFLTFQGTGCPL